VGATREPAAIFAFPGQPAHRLELDRNVSPSRVRFDGLTVHVERSPGARAFAKLVVLRGGATSGGGVTIRTVFEAFDARVERFRRAEYAVSLGLTPDAFL